MSGPVDKTKMEQTRSFTFGKTPESNGNKKFSFCAPSNNTQATTVAASLVNKATAPPAPTRATSTLPTRATSTSFSFKDKQLEVRPTPVQPQTTSSGQTTSFGQGPRPQLSFARPSLPAPQQPPANPFLTSAPKPFAAPTTPKPQQLAPAPRPIAPAPRSTASPFSTSLSTSQNLSESLLNPFHTVQTGEETTTTTTTQTTTNNPFQEQPELISAPSVPKRQSSQQPPIDSAQRAQEERLPATQTPQNNSSKELSSSQELSASLELSSSQGPRPSFNFTRKALPPTTTTTRPTLLPPSFIAAQAATTSSTVKEMLSGSTLNLSSFDLSSVTTIPSQPEEKPRSFPKREETTTTTTTTNPFTTSAPNVLNAETTGIPLEDVDSFMTAFAITTTKLETQNRKLREERDNKLVQQAVQAELKAKFKKTSKSSSEAGNIGNEDSNLPKSTSSEEEEKIEKPVDTAKQNFDILDGFDTLSSLSGEENIGNEAHKEQTSEETTTAADDKTKPTESSSSSSSEEATLTQDKVNRAFTSLHSALSLVPSNQEDRDTFEKGLRDAQDMLAHASQKKQQSAGLFSLAFNAITETAGELLTDAAQQFGLAPTKVVPFTGALFWDEKDKTYNSTEVSTLAKDIVLIKTSPENMNISETVDDALAFSTHFSTLLDQVTKRETLGAKFFALQNAATDLAQFCDPERKLPKATAKWFFEQMDSKDIELDLKVPEIEIFLTQLANGIDTDDEKTFMTFGEFLSELAKRHENLALSREKLEAALKSIQNAVQMSTTTTTTPTTTTTTTTPTTETIIDLDAFAQTFEPTADFWDVPLNDPSDSDTENLGPLPNTTTTTTSTTLTNPMTTTTTTTPNAIPQSNETPTTGDEWGWPEDNSLDAILNGFTESTTTTATTENPDSDEDWKNWDI